MKFGALRSAFEANFAEGLELGARFCLVEGDEIVADLMGGFADRAQTKPFDEGVLSPVFSATKAVASLMMARLADTGALDFTRKAADVWPEFAQAGKAGLTVDQLLSHQAGLCGLHGPMDPEDWYDWDGVCARLSAMAPLWTDRTSGYHPITFGYLAGELFRRADGRTMGEALRQDIAAPLSLDLWIGLPDGEHHRVADLRRPSSLPDLGPITEEKRLAFLEPWSQPSMRDLARWRRAEIPSASGHATAEALALMMAVLANDGEVRGVRLLSPGVAEAAARSRVQGADRVLPFDLSWGAGFLRNEGLWVYGPGRETFGHSGWGGGCVFADPERHLAGAYVMNRQSAYLVGDPRSRRLIEAAYEGL